MNVLRIYITILWLKRITDIIIICIFINLFQLIIDYLIVRQLPNCSQPTMFMFVTCGSRTYDHLFWTCISVYTKYKHLLFSKNSTEINTKIPKVQRSHKMSGPNQINCSENRRCISMQWNGQWPVRYCWFNLNKLLWIELESFGNARLRKQFYFTW